MRKPKRKRKIRTFTIPDATYKKFKRKMEASDKNMSREIEKFMKSQIRRGKKRGR